MINEENNQEKKQFGLSLGNRCLSYGDVLEADAFVKYKSFKEGKIRVKIQSILLTNFETKELSRKRGRGIGRKSGSKLQKIWVKMSRVFPLEKVKNIMRRKQKQLEVVKQSENAKIKIKNLNAVAAKDDPRQDKTHAGGFFKRKVIKEGDRNGLVLYEKEFILSEDKCLKRQQSIRESSNKASLDQIDAESENDEKEFFKEVNLWDFDPYQKEKLMKRMRKEELVERQKTISEEESEIENENISVEENSILREIDDDEIVKLNFRLRLRDKNFYSSYSKDLGRTTKFDISKARQKATARFQSKKFKNYEEIPKKNFEKSLLDIEDDIENSFCNKDNKVCQIINKISLVSKSGEESSFEKFPFSQVFELEDKIQSTEKPKEIVYSESKFFKRCFRVLRKDHSIKISIDNNKISSFQKSLNLFLTFSPNFHSFFKYLDYSIEEFIHIGGEPIAKKNLLYANSVSLELEKSKFLPKKSENETLIHSVKLHSFNRKSHVSLDLSNIEVKHYLCFYLSNYVLERQKPVGKYQLYFVRKKSMIEKQETEEVFDLFKSWVLKQERRGNFEIGEISA